jgi:probable HAF family extracellular repeat protein
MRAFLYANGVMTDLGTLAGFYTAASGINAGGQIVGASNTAGGVANAFLYSNGIMLNLGTLEGGAQSYAIGINASGEVVGYSATASGDTVGFLYSNGVMTDLGRPYPDSNLVSAVAINDIGQVVGLWGVVGGSANHTGPFLYSGGIMTDLGTLGGNDGAANGINNSGQIVGYSTIATSADSYRAFLYSQGVMTNLETLGGDQSQAFGINASGQVVGNSMTAGNVAHAFLYWSGSMFDLNSLLPANSGWVLQWASAINDSGQIVGYGINPAGQYHAFLRDTQPAIASLSPTAVTASGPAFPRAASAARRCPAPGRRWPGCESHTSRPAPPGPRRSPA